MTKFNNQTFIIESQQLVKSEIDGMLCCSDEEIYNRCSDAMQDFKMKMLKQDHMSYYSEQDVEIMDEYHSEAPVGWIKDRRYNRQKLIEIDKSKAYTDAFSKIKLIPVFNEFDQWKPYKGEEIKDYNLYILKVRNVSELRNVAQLRTKPRDYEVVASKKPAKVGEIPNLFFNKTYNLSYGMFCKLWNDYEIVAVKEP